MDEYIKRSMEIINKNAAESGNPHAFYSGMVFGLGHAAAFIKQSFEENDPSMAYGYVMVLLDILDKEHFQDHQT